MTKMYRSDVRKTSGCVNIKILKSLSLIFHLLEIDDIMLNILLMLREYLSKTKMADYVECNIQIISPHLEYNIHPAMYT